MPLAEPKIIAPDSSHWAKWLDAVQSRDPDRRQRALALHGQLIEQGRIPLLSWHHLEELLGGDDDEAARARIAYLQQLPLIAWLRLPRDEVGVGSIVQVLAAEAIAAGEGHADLVSIRDRARTLLLKTGPGTAAIGVDGWVWEAVRPVLRSRRSENDLVAALGPLRTFDENRTIGELCKGEINAPHEMRAQLNRIHAKALQEAVQSNGGDMASAKAMADDFMAMVVARMPPPGTTIRDLIVSALVEQGIDEHEIRDAAYWPILADWVCSEASCASRRQKPADRSTRSNASRWRYCRAG